MYTSIDIDPFNKSKKYWEDLADHIFSLKDTSTRLEYLETNFNFDVNAKINILSKAFDLKIDAMISPDDNNLANLAFRKYSLKQIIETYETLKNE